MPYLETKSSQLQEDSKFKYTMPGVRKKTLNSTCAPGSSQTGEMLAAPRSLKLNITCESPGKACARKKKMALPKRIVRLLESSKRIHCQNVSLSKEWQMCINRPIPETISLPKSSGSLSKQFLSCQVSKEFNLNESKVFGKDEKEILPQRCICAMSNHSTDEFNSSKRSSQTADRKVPTLQLTDSHQKEVVALDCEMVGVGPKGRYSALARCSMVDREGRIMYDRYVKPDQPVTDYRTKWSGVRPRNMVDAVPMSQAKDDVCNILKGKIVVGHAIFNDFQVLNLSHPPRDVRDTSQCRSLVELFGRLCKPGQHPSLKALAKHLLGIEIQKGEHSSVEDACATMDLYKLVEKRWEDALQPVFPDQQFRTSFLDDHFWPEDLF